MNAQDGDDRVTTGSGSDTLYGGSGADTLFGMGASDLIYGNRGADVIYGNQGNDRIYGGQDSDRVYGGQGADVVYGNLGNDVVYGNLGNDTVYGGQGDDTLYGGQGDDNLIGGLGSNTFIGGLGYDNVAVTGNTGDYRLRQLADGSFELVARDGSSTQHLDSTVDQVTFQNGQYLALRDLTAFVEPERPTSEGNTGGQGGGGGGGGGGGPTADFIQRNPDGTINARGLNASGDQLFGNGNGAEHASLLTNVSGGFQTYLRPHERGQDAQTGPVRTDPDGVAVYQLSKGMQTNTRTNASFDFGIVGLSDAISINNIAARILIDTDTTAGTNFAQTTYVKQPRVGQNDAVFQNATTPQAAFGGDEGPQPTYVTANSANFGFASIGSFIDGDLTQPGVQAYNGGDATIDVILRTFGPDGVAEDNRIRLQIGDGVPDYTAQVPATTNSNPTGANTPAQPGATLSDGTMVSTEARDGSVQTSDQGLNLTTNNGNGRTRFNVAYDADNRFRLGDLQRLSFDLTVNTQSGDGRYSPALRLAVDGDGDLSTTNDQGELVFEYAYQSANALITGQTYSFDVAGSDWNAWQRSNGANRDVYPDIVPLSTWASNAGYTPTGGIEFSADSLVLGFSVGLGSGPGSGSQTVDNLIVGGVNYDFTGAGPAVI